MFERYEKKKKMFLKELKNMSEGNRKICKHGNAHSSAWFCTKLKLERNDT